jgi:glutamate--cysteine ligase
VLLNNDLSAGVPDILKGIEQNIMPPLHAGWATRRKSHHFSAYQHVADEFAQLIGIDPWLIDPYFDQCGKIDFQARQGEDCLAEKVGNMLEKIRVKYAEYGIDQPPFVIVKADAGTYGMGIMTVKSADDVRELNRKQRNKMAVGKEGVEVSQVLIQEGVYTFESINGAVAEPVVYMLEHFVVGGFYRVHTGRGADENLNSPGMHFVPLAFDDTCVMPDRSANPDASPNRFYAYGVIARLAMLAASIELDETLHEIENTAAA